jgi:hypothetical protein
LAEIHRNLPRLYHFEAALLAWFSYLAIIVGHECSHGLTCKRFGGKVHEIGLLLIYLQPAMYCNVSDAWLFPEKRHRLLVTLCRSMVRNFLLGAGHPALAPDRYVDLNQLPGPRGRDHSRNPQPVQFKPVD